MCVCVNIYLYIIYPKQLTRSPFFVHGPQSLFSAPEGHAKAAKPIAIHLKAPVGISRVQLTKLLKMPRGFTQILPEITVFRGKWVYLQYDRVLEI